MNTKTPRAQKNNVNKLLGVVGKTYFPSIPLDLIFMIVETGFESKIIDADGTFWSGFLLGDNSNTTFKIKDRKYVLFLSWYKMPSGNYEIVAYVS
jgi:hypothetical protein